jgi:hypothetical protein
MCPSASITKPAIVVPPDLMLLNSRCYAAGRWRAQQNWFQNICPQASGRALTAEKSSDILSF